ncbi:Hypothetical protein PACV_464 [Pacmanvirus A23]|uniref:Hypothetical protein n=1 Tax=Pacmanvirus A23 TaxID=1932881 RepID=UPI000A095C0A|nr:Hypothetical protein B9W72_gp459 [Pacmanvirus A23]SIP86176.1 Hypothetical protein PACV_464 [Pacmanvirus A23]
MEDSLIRVVSYRAKIPNDGVVINATSHSANWSKGLSPFFLGPIKLYGDYNAKVFENAYQYCKVYPQYTENGEPTDEYYKWAVSGWDNPKAVRFPMGRAARPLYSIWDGEKLDYISARKKIYCPLYADAVQKTPAWEELVTTFENCCLQDIKLYIRDFDGYDNYKLKLTYKDILNNPNKKMGHAFVLAMLLDECIEW